MDGSGIYAAVVVAGVSATRVLWCTFSLYLVHRQSLWGSLRFQQQEYFQTVTGRKEYQCLVDTQHPCLCSDSPNGTECHPSHWERNRCLHRGHQRWPGPRLASPTCLADWELWGRELNGCPETVIKELKAAIGSSEEEIVKSWTISFTMIVIESGEKSRVHWVPLLETEKNIVVVVVVERLDCS